MVDLICGLTWQTLRYYIVHNLFRTVENRELTSDFEGATTTGEIRPKNKTLEAEKEDVV